MKQTIKSIAISGLTAIACLTLVSSSFACDACGCAAGKDEVKKEAPKDIVDTAVAAGSFKTLVAAVQAAGLVDTLKSPGPFTVFAPTDAAFAKLPKGTVEALLKNPEKLSAILKYHVVAGNVTSDKVVELTSAKSVQGSPIKISVSDGTVKLNKTSKVVKADIKTANGVIHVIDTVILPPAS